MESGGRDCGRNGVDQPGRVVLPGRDYTVDECLDFCRNSTSCNFIGWKNTNGECRMYETCDGSGETRHTRFQKLCPETPYICPYGMHQVAAPVRSDDYYVGTADFGEVGPDEYIPGQLIDIHLRSL